MPLAVVMVKLSAGKAVVSLATALEDHDAVVARLLTTTMLFPTAAPADAEPVTTLGLEELTVAADKGPVRLLSDCTSLSRLVASVWRLLRAVV